MGLDGAINAGSMAEWQESRGKMQQEVGNKKT